MKRPSEPGGQPAMLFVFAVAALLFGSPMRLLWLREEGPWYQPFAVWLGVIALGAWAARRSGHDA
ncbi:MAG TPA: hypothetical protein VLQ93_19265 [Myxococcaceae bacterium]|nr:hypothetical protein [Myxococcaceae bacterium]